MTIRLLNLGEVSPIRSQAIYHGVAYAMGPDDPDTITLMRPSAPYVCIGHHQDAATEVDLEYCAEAGLAVYRREVGGGAVYLDGGLEMARKFVHDKILCNFDDLISNELHTNFKSMLLEYAQSRNLGAPFYNVQAVNGPDHEKVFTIQVKIQDEALGSGTANSKKRAEQLAAREALKNLYLI